MANDVDKTPETDPQVEDLPNIGKQVAARLARIGIRTRQDLEAVGPVGAFQRLRALPGPPPSLRFYLFGLDAALLGLPVRDLPRSRRTLLARAALELSDAHPAYWIRPRRVIRSRRHR